MTMLGNLTIDPRTPQMSDRARLTTWYAQGHSDGLGDRLLMFDNSNAPSWEILRFTPVLARNPRFEAAVLDRVEQLRSFSHHAFPVVRSVGDLDGNGGLAVVSTHVAGVLLSDAAKKPRTAALALRVVHQLASALAAFHDHAPGIAHRILTSDRITLAAGGRLIIREHMVGSGVDALGLSPHELWTSLGVLRPPVLDGVIPDEGLSDVSQLALVAMSLMAGRRLGPEVYPGQITAWLDGIAARESRHDPESFQTFRMWLERALHVTQPFESARQASEWLAAWCGGSNGEGTCESPRVAVDVRVFEPHLTLASGGTDVPARDMQLPNASLPPADAERSARYGRRSLGRGHLIRWAAIGAAVLAVVEAALIGRLIYGRSPTAVEPPVVRATVSQPGPVIAEAAPQFVNRQAPAPALPPPADDAVVERASARTEVAQGAVASSTQRGGFRISSQVELHVLDGERLLGSSGEGPIIAAAGRREFEFVNSAIGYRVRRTVDIKAGQITPVSVSVPNGRLNINATPWAEVWIDGRPYGETPLGNVSILPGEHTIRFRHPELGERWEKTIVRSDVPARVSVNLQR